MLSAPDSVEITPDILTKSPRPHIPLKKRRILKPNAPAAYSVKITPDVLTKSPRHGFRYSKRCANGPFFTRDGHFRGCGVKIIGFCTPTG